MRDLWDIYRLPFRHDMPNGSGYIVDADGNLVAWHSTPTRTLEVRGWGRISYMDLAEARHDACEQRIKELVGAPHIDDIEQTVAVLNERWREGCMEPYAPSWGKGRRG